MRQIAFGVLGWGPAEFHGATMRDLFDGMQGWMEANGAKPKPPSMTDEELRDLMARYPDG